MRHFPSPKNCIMQGPGVHIDASEKSDKYQIGVRNQKRDTKRQQILKSETETKSETRSASYAPLALKKDSK